MELNSLCCTCCSRFWTGLWQAPLTVYPPPPPWYVQQWALPIYESTSSLPLIFGRRHVFLGPTTVWNATKPSLRVPHQRQTQDKRSPITSCLISLYFFGIFSGGGAVCLAAVPCLRLAAECRAGTLKAWTLLVGGGISRSLRCRGFCWCLRIAPEISSAFPVFVSWFSVWRHLVLMDIHTYTHRRQRCFLPTA